LTSASFMPGGGRSGASGRAGRGAPPGVRGKGPCIDCTGTGVRCCDAPGWIGLGRVTCDGAVDGRCGTAGCGPVFEVTTGIGPDSRDAGTTGEPPEIRLGAGCGAATPGTVPDLSGSTNFGRCCCPNICPGCGSGGAPYAPGSGAPRCGGTGGCVGIGWLARCGGCCVGIGWLARCGGCGGIAGWLARCAGCGGIAGWLARCAGCCVGIGWLARCGGCGGIAGWLARCGGCGGIAGCGPVARAAGGCPGGDCVGIG